MAQKLLVVRKESGHRVYLVTTRSTTSCLVGRTTLRPYRSTAERTKAVPRRVTHPSHSVLVSCPGPRDTDSISAQVMRGLQTGRLSVWEILSEGPRRLPFRWGSVGTRPVAAEEWARITAQAVDDTNDDADTDGDTNDDADTNDDTNDDADGDTDADGDDDADGDTDDGNEDPDSGVDADDVDGGDDATADSGSADGDEGPAGPDTPPAPDAPAGEEAPVDLSILEGINWGDLSQHTAKELRAFGKAFTPAVNARSSADLQKGLREAATAAGILE